MLRSMRYGEADRILHLYTPMRGRVSAIAKGVRRTRSRFGGRLEPFSHVDCSSTKAASDLLTVTGADTIARARAPARRRRARSTRRAARAMPSPGCSRSGDPHPEVFHLLCNELRAARGRPGATRRSPTSSRSGSSCSSPRASAPQLSACASCGEREHLAGFSGAAGGVVCAACEASAFPLDEAAHGFMVEALGRPLAQTPAVECARCARSSARSPRSPSTTRTFVCAPQPPDRIGDRGRRQSRRSGSTTSPRGRARCATCSAARARTSPR